MKVKSQSDPSRVPAVDNSSSTGAHDEMPKISSVSSVKSKASNTSVRSKLGSQSSLKKESNTSPNVSIIVVPSKVYTQSSYHSVLQNNVLSLSYSLQSEKSENKESDADASIGIPKSSSRSSRSSQPSLRVFMKAMSDVVTKVNITVIHLHLSLN